MSGDRLAGCCAAIGDGAAAASAIRISVRRVRLRKASGIIDEVLLRRIVIPFGWAVVVASVAVARMDVRLTSSAKATEVKKPDATTIGTPSAGSDAVPGVLISRQLLARANLSIGDVVTVAADPAGTRAAQFRVAGVYEPTPDPMKFNVERLEARLHLDDLLSLTADPSDPASNESVTSINVALADPADAAAFSRTIAARIP